MYVFNNIKSCTTSVIPFTCQVTRYFAMAIEYDGNKALVTRTFLTIYYYDSNNVIKRMTDIDVAGATSYTGSICVNMDMKAVAVVPSGPAVKVRSLPWESESIFRKERERV